MVLLFIALTREITKILLKKGTNERNKRWRNYRPEDDETSKDAVAENCWFFNFFGAFFCQF